MGTYLKGILGSFSGKVGTVIGSKWNGISYMRSLSTPSGKDATPAQLLQRARFGLVMGFVSPIRTLLNVGFKNESVGQTGVNAATTYLLNEAVIGDDPLTLVLDYSKVLFSKGSLTGAAGTAVGGSSKVTVSWPNNSGSGNAKGDDQAMILVYDPTDKLFAYEMTAAQRSAATAEVLVPASFSTHLVQVWLAFISDDGRSVSTSMRLSPVTVA